MYHHIRKSISRIFFFLRRHDFLHGFFFFPSFLLASLLTNFSLILFYRGILLRLTVVNESKIEKI